MSYFNLFPDIGYAYGDNGERKIAKNILRRFTFKDYIKNNADLYVRYQMKQSDTYQSLAKQLYGSADLAWLLYLMNDIQDPYVDIPKTPQELTSYINQRYPGNAIFLGLDSFGGDFNAGEIIRGQNGYSARVVSWDGNMRKMVVEDEHGSLTANETITGDTSTSTGTFKRLVNNLQSVHHFEDLFGNKINHLPSPLDDETSPLESYLEQSEQPNTKIVTNKEYEEALNQEKRKIKILRVEYRDQILADAERVFQ